VYGLVVHVDPLGDRLGCQAVGAGAEYDLLAYLVARYIGLYRYGSIYGVLYSAFAVVGGSAPVVYGAGFDRWGSYAPVLTVSAVAMALSAVAMLFLGRYPDFDVPEQAGGADLLPSANASP
jgi:hypothetical protein